MENKTDSWETLYRRMAEISVMKEYTELELEAENTTVPEPSDKFVDFMNGLIEDLDEKERKTRAPKHIRYRVIAVAAVITVLAGLALTAGALGIKFSALFTNSTSTHTDIVFRDNLTTPTGWDTIYYITALPEGYQLVDQNNNDGCLISIYSTAKGSASTSPSTITLYQYRKAPDILSVDTEGMEQKEIEIQGTIGTCLWNEERILLAWQHDEDYLMLGTDLDEDTALMAANSIQK